MPYGTTAETPDPLSAVLSIRAAEPAAFDTNDAARYIGVGMTKFFEEMKAGRIKTRKCGRRTLVLRADLDAWLSTLPESA